MTRIAVLVLLVLISGCVQVGTFAQRADRVSPEIKVLKSDIWVTREGHTIEVEYRLIYRLISRDGFTDILVSHVLKDDSHRVLSRKETTKRQRPGIYPLTLSFNISGKAISGGGSFFIETLLAAPFGTARDARPFTLTDLSGAKPGEGEKRFDIYGYLREQIQGLSDPCPYGTVPIVRETIDAKGTTGKLYLECLRENEFEDTVGEIDINYPETGGSYPIKRSVYPGFYIKLDLNGDGMVTMRELGRIQPVFNTITAKYPEGDVDSVVKEFMRRNIR